MADLTIDGLRAYLAQPERPAKSGVLMLPTIAGINAMAKRYCAWINTAGLTVLVWDPFSAFPNDLTPEQRGEVALNGQLKDAACRQEQVRFVSHMVENLGLDKVAVIGFCLGGRQAFSLAAVDHRLKACVAYHPSIRDPKPEHDLDAVALAGEIQCPVQVLYPGRDHITSRQSFDALRQALESRPAATVTHVYPGAVHGFMDEARQDDPGNAGATALSWPQSAAFLSACLI